MPALRERGDDAALLFRKFALDMSERYKMPAIRLTEDAQRMLVAYSWPGNVRQLKNLTENMSVTAEEREINAEALSHYLPRESKHTQLVALAEKKEQHSFENEREILYQILFDLRRDVSELKRIVREQQTTDESALHASRTETPNLLFDHGAQVKLAKDAEADVPYWDAEEVNDDEVPSVFEVLQSPVLNTSDLKPAMAAKQPQSLNEVERDTIAKTLELCNGRRKMAAEQLGISERTLYRKIKEYGLE